MKSELEQQDIEAIAQRVSELMKPMVSGNSKQDNDMVFDKEGVAKYLHSSKSTIDKLVSNNQIPFFKLSNGQSGGVRFNKKHIDKWIEKRTVPDVIAFTLRR